MFYFPFAGQASNWCHWVCHGCCWCLLLAGLAPGQIQRETVLTGHRMSWERDREPPAGRTRGSLWLQLLLRLTNNCVALAEGITSLIATYAFISLPVMIFVVVWEHLQANSPSSQPQCSAEGWCKASYTHPVLINYIPWAVSVNNLF